LVVTLHRHWVDGPFLAEVMGRLGELAEHLPVVFPVHPRTRAAMEALGMETASERLRLVEPVGYIEFMSLVGSSAGVLTDSGGIQEETTYLGLPCFTLRPNTERPVTLVENGGTNVVLGAEPERIADVPALLGAALAGAKVPPLWDGRAAERIVDVLARSLGGDRVEQLGQTLR
jgi:UDP-N-acetylglucosamine 2-epimerase (non-hydrolysing)